MPKFGLIARIALLVIGIEVAAFGTLGWFYIDRFSSAADENIRMRLQLVGHMIAREELPLSSIARQALMSELVGAPCLKGMAVGGNGRVVVATNPTYLGRPARDVPGLNAGWFDAAAPDEQLIVGPGSLTSIVHIKGGVGDATLYTMLIEIGTTELAAQKRSIVWWGVIGSLMFIVLGSTAIVLIAQRFVARRVDDSLAILKAVENGALDARIAVSSDDELGQLQRGINSMTAKVGTLLNEHREHAEELKRQKDLLQSVIGHAPIRVFWKDAALRYLGCNGLFAHDAGLSRPEELIGKTDFDMGWRDQAERYRADDRAVMASGVPQLDFEEPQTTPDGGTLWLSTSKVPLRGAQDEVIGVLGIYADITERKRNIDELERYRHHLEQLVEARTAELTRAKLAAEAASVAKSSFLANMSHELRTPMNAIMGMTDLALRRATEPKLIEQLKTVLQASHHLLQVINDILDISKIEAERLTLEHNDFKLGEVLENLMSMIDHKARDKRLKLLVDLPPEVACLSLQGDPLRLGQVLINLASNAVKFTERGSVAVRGRLVDDAPAQVLLRFEVQDSGIGIEAADQRRLFNAFEQADSSTTRKYGGTGLGLAISKRLVHLMGGEIGVESTVGTGSTFWFTVRLNKVINDAVAPAPTFDDTAAEARIKNRYAGTRVLLVEDEPISQEVARAFLEDAGLVVDWAEDGALAVELAKQTGYSLILMDMQMPNLNGVDATRAIRQLPGYRHTPILAMTANAYDEDRQVCRAAGMNDHIAKPINANVLFEILLKWLERPGPGDDGAATGPQR